MKDWVITTIIWVVLGTVSQGGINAWYQGTMIDTFGISSYGEKTISYRDYQEYKAFTTGICYIAAPLTFVISPFITGFYQDGFSFWWEDYETAMVKIESKFTERR